MSDLKKEEEKQDSNIEEKINNKIKEIEEFMAISSGAIDKLNIQEARIINIKESLEAANYDAYYNHKTLSEINKRRAYDYDPNFIPYYDEFNTAAAGFKLNPRYIANSIENVERNLNTLTGMTSASNMYMGTGAAMIRNYIEENTDNKIYHEINLSYPWSNPITEKDVLKIRINNIKTRLAETLDSIWDSLLFKGRQEENRAPAHLIREFMSDFLHTLTPRDEILKLPWCEKSQNENPTQVSMVIYVIEGPSKVKSLKKFNINIINIAKEFRKLYQKLNGYTHYRGESVDRNIRTKLKTYAEIIQNLTKEILKLRTLRLISDNYRIDIGPCIDGGEIDIEILCSNCENRIAFDSIEFPSPYMGGKKEIDSWRQSEYSYLYCDDCDTEYTVYVDNSMYKAIIDFTEGPIPLYVDYRLRQKPLDDEF